MKLKIAFIIVLQIILLNQLIAENEFCRSLLSQMTLEEKIGQLNQISLRGEINEETKRALRAGKIGSVINIDRHNLNDVQRIVMEESRMKIPVVFARDVIHGYKTIFPIPLGQAASFNPEIVKAGAAVAAKEAYADGIRWTFAPMLDISRDARWGRIAESLGEDPYLASVLGKAMIKGFQGDDLAAKNTLAACAKHFAGYGAAEGGRDYNSTNIPPILLHNVYLPPFKAAKEAGVASMMASFNDNDGIPLTGDKSLLYDLLKKQWGFDGMVVSDWNAINEMIKHGYASDRKDAALKALTAGVDMDMMSSAFINELNDLVKDRPDLINYIDNAVLRVLEMKYNLGLFNNPHNVPNDAVHYATDHLAMAQQAAEESFILLKNDKTLPISNSYKKIAVIGPMADAPHDQLGTWVFDGEKEKTVTPLKAIKDFVGNKVQIIYEPGLRFSRDMDASGIRKAVAAARKSDVVLLFLGEESILSGEAHSLADLNLKGLQSELTSALHKTGKPIVIIFMAGRPLTVENEIKQANAVLYGFHPGTMGGPAIVRILFGEVNPSGKLPVTFPRHVGQIPLYYNHNNTGRPAPKELPALEDIPLEAKQTSLGNTSFYLDYGIKPLYPFGFGLSYTHFEYNDFQVKENLLNSYGTITFKGNITNSGKYTGTETVQLYIQDVTASVARPVRELKRFARINLQPGESKVIEFNLSLDDLAFYNRELKKVTEKGIFRAWIGTDSTKGEMLEFEY